MSRLHVPIAAHVLLTRADGKVLFQRRAGTGFADGQWSVPAGHVEAGETFHAAAARELREETGVSVTVTDLELLCVQQKLDTDGQERVDVFFRAAVPADQQPQILEPDRCDGLRWATPAAPPEPVVAYVGAALRQIAGGVGVLSYFGYETPD